MRPIRTPLLVLAVVGMVGAAPAPALAQQPIVYPPPCDASKVSLSDVDRAHTVYLSGKQYLDESNYDKAISYFVDAYSIDCSVHGILPIIATAYERKGDKGEAIRALAEYGERSPNAPDHDVVARRIKNLKDQLTKEQPPTATPSTGPPTPSPAPPPSTGTTQAPPAPLPSEPAAVPAPPAPSAPQPSHEKSGHLGPWILVGAGGAAVVTGAVLFGVGAGDVSTASSASHCGPSRTNCSKDDAAQGNRGRTLEGVGVAVGGVGVAAVVGGLVWFVADKSPGSPQQSAGWRAAPVVLPGYAGLGLAAKF